MNTRSIGPQSRRILDHIRLAGGNWSIGELAEALGLDKSAVSARIHELVHEHRRLVRTAERPDRVSGKMVHPVALSNGEAWS